ncbi:MAG: flagellar FliJ family protein [Chthoniobacteraceae bacterium]
MKPFRFTLESILELRHREEDAARLELSRALEQQREAASVCRMARERLEDVLKQIAESSTHSFNVAERRRQWSLKQAQQDICDRSQKLLDECTRVVEARRGVVIKARHNRELLERLKTTRREDAEREAQLEEQIIFDELAMSRSHRTALKGAAVAC